MNLLLLLAALAVQPYNQPRQDVDLLLQAPTTVPVGGVLEVELRAHAVKADTRFTMVTAVIQWDATRLELLDHGDTGPYDWFYMPPGVNGWLDYGDGGLDDMDYNNTWTDGTAGWCAAAQFDTMPVATVDGLPVVTLRFRALAAGPTGVWLTGLKNPFMMTEVYAADVGGLGILRRARACVVTVVPLPAYVDFAASMRGPAVGRESATDLDDDGDVDLEDYARFQNAFVGGK